MKFYYYYYLNIFKGKSEYACRNNIWNMMRIE